MRARMVTGIFAALLCTATAYAQEPGAGAGRFEVGAFPGGAMFLTASENGNGTDFANYAVGGSFTVNLNQWIGLEGEGGGAVGVHQDFTLGTTPFTNQRTPNMWSYGGNIVVSPAGNHRSIVPFVVGGLGGLTITPTGNGNALGITNYDTYLTGNMGGGLKWFSTRHFGVRGDYRFFMVKNNDTAPLLFSNQNRYGHRVQAGLVFTY
jgi:outer membrane protein with beta-barrel domain